MTEKTLAQIEMLKEEFPDYGDNFGRALYYISEQYNISPIELAEEDEDFFYKVYPTLYENITITDGGSQSLFERSLDKYFTRLKEEYAPQQNSISFFFNNPVGNAPNMPNSIVARAFSAYGDDGGEDELLTSHVDPSGNLSLTYDDTLNFIGNSTINGEDLDLHVDDEQITAANIVDDKLEVTYIGE